MHLKKKKIPFRIICNFILVLQYFYQHYYYFKKMEITNYEYIAFIFCYCCCIYINHIKEQIVILFQCRVLGEIEKMRFTTQENSSSIFSGNLFIVIQKYTKSGTQVYCNAFIQYIHYK